MVPVPHPKYEITPSEWADITAQFNEIHALHQILRSFSFMLEYDDLTQAPADEMAHAKLQLSHFLGEMFDVSDDPR